MPCKWRPQRDSAAAADPESPAAGPACPDSTSTSSRRSISISNCASSECPPHSDSRPDAGTKLCHYQLKFVENMQDNHQKLTKIAEMNTALTN